MGIWKRTAKQVTNASEVGPAIDQLQSYASELAQSEADPARQAIAKEMRKAVERIAELETSLRAITPPQDRQQTSKPQLLIVDDEEDICDMLEAMLDNSFEVSTISRSTQASQLIQGNNYDVVVTDLNMPGVDGVAIIEQVKQHNPKTPVLVISGHARTDVDLAAAFEAGAQGLLSKPFPPRDELEAILLDYIDETKDSD